MVVKEYREESEITVNKSADSLVFDSHFEGGNLFAAFKVRIGRVRLEIVRMNY